MEPFKLGHRKTLDGVRGLAILFVLLSHITILPLHGGFIGVDVFFVLSGFLITSLLLEEWGETGGISLKAFYARRALRLLPALVVMLAAVVGLSAAVEKPSLAAEMRTSAVMTLFYAANWCRVFRLYPRTELLPTWSLSVEEQFYIVWPLLLMFLLRTGWSRRTLGLIVAAGMLASAGARAALFFTTGSTDRVYFGSDTHADGLLAGGLAAMLAHWGVLSTSKRLSTGLNVLGLVALAHLAVFLPLGWLGDPSLNFGGYLLINLEIAALVACMVASPWRPLRAVFEFPPLAWIGRVSYGLYLWHIAVFWGLSATRWSGGWTHWPVAVALTFGFAAASFYAIERPILKLKRRFERVRPPGPISP